MVAGDSTHFLEIIPAPHSPQGPALSYSGGLPGEGGLSSKAEPHLGTLHRGGHLGQSDRHWRAGGRRLCAVAVGWGEGFRLQLGRLSLNIKGNSFENQIVSGLEKFTWPCSRTLHFPLAPSLSGCPSHFHGTY